jgi:amino acid transporter
MNPKNFFAELKRRNVYKVAVAYAVVAWLLLQGASIVLSSFEAPAWTMKVLIVALAVGLPVAVGLAWVLRLRRKESCEQKSSGLRLLSGSSLTLDGSSVLTFDFWKVEIVQENDSLHQRSG